MAYCSICCRITKFLHDPKPFSRERIIFSTNGAWTTDYTYVEELNWTPTSHRIQKLKMDNTPKCKVKTAKVLEENIGQKLHDSGFGSSFLRYDTKSTSNQSKHKVDLID